MRGVYTEFPIDNVKKMEHGVNLCEEKCTFPPLQCFLTVEYVIFPSWLSVVWRVRKGSLAGHMWCYFYFFLTLKTRRISKAPVSGTVLTSLLLNILIVFILLATYCLAKWFPNLLGESTSHVSVKLAQLS